MEPGGSLPHSQEPATYPYHCLEYSVLFVDGTWRASVVSYRQTKQCAFNHQSLLLKAINFYFTTTTRFGFFLESSSDESIYSVGELNRYT
jgi:hypothetical protein